MTFIPRFFLISLALTAPCVVRAAHLCTSDTIAGDTRNEFQAWGGYSPHAGGPISSTPHTEFGVGGFLYSRRCWSSSKVSLGYNIGLMPVALVHVPTIAFSGPPIPTLVPTSGGVWTVGGTYTWAGVVANSTIISPAHTVYGFAATPIGFTFDAWRSSRIYPFAQVDGGLIKSSEPVPYNVPGATSGNFLVSLGGGVKIPAGKSLAFSAGYKLMHMSNAGRSSFNPGLDNNVFFAGISLLK